MRFVELHDYWSGKPWSINLAQVTDVAPLNSDKNDSGTLLYLAVMLVTNDGVARRASIIVKEPYVQVATIITAVQG